MALAPQAKCNVKDIESDQRMISARESVLRWFVAFTVRFKRTYVVPMSPNVNQSVVSISSTDSSEPGSPGAIDGVGVSPERNKETLFDASEVIRKVLYSTRSNVRLLHEVFRQVNGAHLCVIFVLRNLWKSHDGLFVNLTSFHFWKPAPGSTFLSFLLWLSLVSFVAVIIVCFIIILLTNAQSHLFSPHQLYCCFVRFQ